MLQSGIRRKFSWRTFANYRAGSTRIREIPGAGGKTDRGSDEKPLVVLSGWLLAKEKHLQKYSDMYNSLGYPTLCLTPPSILHALKIYSSEKYSSAMMQILENSYSGPIVFHLFSISPTILLPYFTDVAERANLKNIQLKGIIFDSGPVFYCHKTAVAAAKKMMEDGGMNRLAYYTFTISSSIADTFQVGTNAREELSVALKRQVLAVPQLYLYSDRDPVAKMEWVEKVMGEQRGLGRPVEGVMFQRSNHVKLLQSEPVKYTNLVTSFLNNISSTQ